MPCYKCVYSINSNRPMKRYQNSHLEELDRMQKEIQGNHIHCCIKSAHQCYSQYAQAGSSKKIAIDLYSLLAKQIKNNELFEKYDKNSSEQQMGQMSFRIATKLSNIIRNLCLISESQSSILLYPLDDDFYQLHFYHHLGHLIELAENVKCSGTQDVFTKFQQSLYNRIKLSLIKQLRAFRLLEIWQIAHLKALEICSNPLAAQMAYMASQGYCIFTWNPQPLKLVPVGIYIINLEYAKLENTYQRVHLKPRKQQQIDLEILSNQTGEINKNDYVKVQDAEISVDRQRREGMNNQFWEETNAIVYSYFAHDVCTTAWLNCHESYALQNHKTELVPIQHFIYMAYIDVMRRKRRAWELNIRDITHTSSFKQIIHVGHLSQQEIEQIATLFLIWEIYPVDTGQYRQEVYQVQLVRIPQCFKMAILTPSSPQVKQNLIDIRQLKLRKVDNNNELRYLKLEDILQDMISEVDELIAEIVIIPELFVAAVQAIIQKMDAKIKLKDVREDWKLQEWQENTGSTKQSTQQKIVSEVKENRIEQNVRRMNISQQLFVEDQVDRPKDSDDIQLQIDFGIKWVTRSQFNSNNKWDKKR